MEQGLKTKMENVVAMTKESINFYTDIRNIYDDLVSELGGKNLVSKDSTVEKSVFDNKSSGFFYQHLQASENGCLIGFSIDIVFDDDYLEYDKYIATIAQLNIDKKVPLLITYGCFKLVDASRKTKKIDGDYDYFFGYCQGVLDEDDEKFTYTNFDKSKIGFDTEIIIENEDWTDKEGSEELGAWEEFFSKAKIKFKPLLELKNHNDVVVLAEEIKSLCSKI